MDLIRHYSNDLEVASNLAASLSALRDELGRSKSKQVSVRSTRTERVWKVEDRVTDEVIEKIRADYVPRVVTHKELAERYGLSQKSVQRILRGRR